MASLSLAAMGRGVFPNFFFFRVKNKVKAETLGPSSLATGQTLSSLLFQGPRGSQLRTLSREK